MRLSELLKRLRPAGLANCSAYLASPDPTHAESAEVQLIPVGEIEHDYLTEELRLRPVSMDTVPADQHDYSVFGTLLHALASEAVLNDPRVLIELPLLRDRPHQQSFGYAELRDVHVSPHTNEVWLLVLPRAAFPVGSLSD